MSNEAIEAPALSLELLRKELEQLHRGVHRTVRSAFYARMSEPVEGRQIKLEGKEKPFRVVEVTGELDLRHKLTYETDHYTVYVVPFARQLPRDLEASFATGRLGVPQIESTLPRRFGARSATPRLLASRLRLIAQREGSRSYAQGDAPSVDLDDAWMLLLRDRLRSHPLETEAQLFVACLLAGDAPGKDLDALLETEAGALSELLDVASRRLGSCAGTILRAWLSESTVELAALALVGEATRVALTESGGEGHDALVTALEMRVTQRARHPLAPLRSEEGVAGIVRRVAELGHLVPVVWERMAKPEQKPLREAILRETDTVLSLEKVRATAQGHRLPFVFDRRVKTFVDALHVVVAAKDGALTAALPALERASHDLRAHELTATHPALEIQLKMAGRLAAFLAEPVPATQQAPAAEVALLAQWQLDVGGFVDHARQLVRGDSAGPLGKSLQPLVARVDALRDTLDARFAAAYARTVRHDADRRALTNAVHVDGKPLQVTLIEDALAKLALPWLRANPSLRLLVLCMDGMSTANFVELWASLDQDSALVPVSHGVRPAVIAQLPTVTKLSRSALFAGRALAPGESTDTSREADRLAKHTVVKELGGGSQVLLRGDILGRDGTVSPDVLRAIAEADRVVGVVVNAIDDQLKGSAQLRVSLTRDHIVPLRALLEAAESAGRLVLLCSDHGNISSLRFIGAPVRATHAEEGVESGARYRLLREKQKAETDEVELPFGALPAPKGYDRVAVAVAETVRYTLLLHAGEHGGASLAEAVAPFVLLAPRGLIPELEKLGVHERPLTVPIFWDRDGLPPSEVPVPPVPDGRRKPAKKEPLNQAALPFADPIRAQLDDLFKSKLFLAQTEGVAESTVADVKRVVELLMRHGGVLSWDKFAVELGIDTNGRGARVPGYIDKLERVLNFGGDAVIEADRPSQRVMLDRNLLRSIFIEDQDG